MLEHEHAENIKNFSLPDQRGPYVPLPDHEAQITYRNVAEAATRLNAALAPFE